MQDFSRKDNDVDQNTSVSIDKPKVPNSNPQPT
jgi:hypothetical protein